MTGVHDGSIRWRTGNDGESAASLDSQPESSVPRRGLKVGSQYLPGRGARAHLPAFPDQVPGSVRFFESPDPDMVAALAGRYPVFRVVAA